LRERLEDDLVKDVRRLRRRLDLPLAVGFGISTPAQVAEVGRIADGVVVGSELVRLVAEHGTSAALPRLVEQRVRELAAPLHEVPPKRRWFGG
jgi:tryptophan synthase alpha chain